MDTKIIINILKEKLKLLQLEEEIEAMENVWLYCFFTAKIKHKKIDDDEKYTFYHEYLYCVKNSETGIVEEINKRIESLTVKENVKKSIRNSPILGTALKKILKTRRKIEIRNARINNLKRTANIEFIKSLIGYLQPDNNRIFYEFGQLEEFLSNTNISSNNQAKIIMTIIDINAERFSSPNVDPTYPDKEKIKKHTFHNISESEKNTIVEYNLIDAYVDYDSPINTKKKLELLEFILTNPYDYTEAKGDMLLINGIMLKSEKTDEDYREITYLLENLGITNARKIVSKIKEKKKEPEEVKKIIQFKPVEKEKIKKDTIPQKEINKLVREANTYFDFEQMQPIRVLTLNEIIYVLSLLKQTHADERTIERFLLISQKELRKSDSITVLEQYYNKIFYHMDNEQVKYYLNKINETLEEHKITSSDDEMYPIVQPNVDAYMKEIFKAINNDFSFEEECSKGMKKKLN